MIKMIYPVGTNWIVTQTFERHKQRATEMGCCSEPKTGCSCYYYGAIDWGCSTGTPVYAPADSIAHIEVQNQGKSGYGLNVRITHADGYYSILAHLSEVVVKTGDDVKQGQLIGYSGGATNSPTSGNSTGPHLHFEVRKNGTPVDPMTLLTTSVITPPQSNVEDGYAVVNATWGLNMRDKPNTLSKVYFTAPYSTKFKVGNKIDDDWIEIIIYASTKFLDIG